jgi:light-regulated signal transduction histidine kinase (bacteriophytochrome)
MRQWMRNSLAIALLGIVLAFVIAYLISDRLQKQISRPILALAETAKAVSDRRDYSVRATKRGNDELGTLTDAFNHMLAQIETLNRTLEERVAARTGELEMANKELEAFSYSVSHDLRAPLRAVDGFSQAVLEDYGAQLPEEGQRYLQTIRTGAQRMGALIDDLLTFSRLSRAALTQQSVNTTALVNEAVQELREQSAGREIDFRLSNLPDCEGDPALLKQVWINLLSNALKYTRKRKQALIEIGSRLENGENVYYIRDNGTGFDMRYADKLFGVFQRLHRVEEFEGTGVGLAIVQRVVHRHGGRIWAQAEVERGAEFCFTLGEGVKHA